MELQIKATQKNLFIAGSYIIQQKDNTFSNQLVMISPDGKIVSWYNKIHLFFQFDEKILFSQGQNPAILKIKRFKHWICNLL